MPNARPHARAAEPFEQWSAQTLLLRARGKPNYERLVQPAGAEGPRVLIPCADGREIRVLESDPAFVEKSILAMTAVRASYRGYPPADEAEASKALGIRPPLPPGFYVLSPERDQIVAALLPDLAGENGEPLTSRAEEFASRAAALGEAVAPECWISSFRIEPEAFFAAYDPFADLMMLSAPDGALSEDEPGIERSGAPFAERPKDFELLERFGMSLSSRTLGSSMEIPSYPAPYRLHASASHSAYAEPADRGFLVRRSQSFHAPWRDLEPIPLINHFAGSAINNARDILLVAERAPEREKIARTIARTLFNIENIESGALDHRIDASRADSPAALEELRRKAARSDLQTLGKARKLFVGQQRTTSFESSDGSSTLLLSADMALVDGQHSSRDYALIAQTCLRAGDDPGFVPSFGEASASDCSAPALRAMILSEYRESFAQLEAEKRSRAGLPPIRSESGEAPPRPTPAQEAAFWERYRRFVGDLTTQIDVMPSLDPKTAREYTIVENEIRAQSIAARALSEHHALVVDYAERFTRYAIKAEDPARLHTVKSHHSDSGFSSVAERGAPFSASSSEFARIYPFLKAISDSEKTMSSRQQHVVEAERREASSRATAETAALFSRMGLSSVRSDDPLFEQAHRRFLVLYQAIGTLKGRPYEMTPDSLGGTLQTIYGLRAAKGCGSLKTFAKLALSHAARFLLEGAERLANPLKSQALRERAASLAEDYAKPQPDDAGLDARCFALGKAAIALHGAVASAREADKSVQDMMTRATLDNTLLTLLAATGEHPASESALEGMRSAARRLRSVAQADGYVPFNAAREFFRARWDPKAEPPAELKHRALTERYLRDAGEFSIFAQIPQGACRALFDMIPLPGPSWDELRASLQARARLGSAPAALPERLRGSRFGPAPSASADLGL